jgi:predicted MPP superfamily phosphohydrolase
MTIRRVRRRDFSRHWAMSDGARGLLRGGRRLIEWRPLPWPVFLALLALLALVAGRGPTPLALALGLFLLGDWLLLAMLPRRGKSFGAPQPGCLILAVPRLAIAQLPVPLAAAMAVQGIGTLLAFYGAWIEPHRIGVTRQRLRAARLPSGPPLRVLHLGDLHVERVTARERQLVALAASLQPDLVLFSGDLLNTSYVRDSEAWAACRWVLERLPAPLGVLLVSGSSASDPDDVLESLLDGLPVRWLRDERVTLEHGGRSIDVVGVGCTHQPFLDREPLMELVRHDRFTILAYHPPDLAPDAAEAGVDLMLSGHTHGGQVRLPLVGALVTSSLYGKAFEMGRYELGGTTLYVTRGLGMEGSGAPRIRFLCPPEVVLWEIEGAATRSDFHLCKSR